MLTGHKWQPTCHCWDWGLNFCTVCVFLWILFTPERPELKFNFTVSQYLYAISSDKKLSCISYLKTAVTLFAAMAGSGWPYPVCPSLLWRYLMFQLGSTVPPVKTRRLYIWSEGNSAANHHHSLWPLDAIEPGIWANFKRLLERNIYKKTLPKQWVHQSIVSYGSVCPQPFPCLLAQTSWHSPHAHWLMWIDTSLKLPMGCQTKVVSLSLSNGDVSSI